VSLTCPACGYEATSAADLNDHRIIRRYTDPDRHTDQHHQPKGNTPCATPSVSPVSPPA
jgi:hypothetical protein